MFAGCRRPYPGPSLHLPCAAGGTLPAPVWVAPVSSHARRLVPVPSADAPRGAVTIDRSVGRIRGLHAAPGVRAAGFRVWAPLYARPGWKPLRPGWCGPRSGRAVHAHAEPGRIRGRQVVKSPPAHDVQTCAGERRRWLALLACPVGAGRSAVGGVSGQRQAGARRGRGGCQVCPQRTKRSGAGRRRQFDQHPGTTATSASRRTGWSGRGTAARHRRRSGCPG